VRIYVPAAATDLRRLEDEGRLGLGDRLPALAVTPWAVSELDVAEAEDEEAEFAVLGAAGRHEVDGAPPVAVLVFDVQANDVPSEGLQLRLEGELPRRRLVAVHVLPDLAWYAGHELPDVLATMTRPLT
jgi:hypothetical protein